MQGRVRTGSVTECCPLGVTHKAEAWCLGHCLITVVRYRGKQLMGGGACFGSGQGREKAAGAWSSWRLHHSTEGGEQGMPGAQLPPPQSRTSAREQQAAFPRPMNKIKTLAPGHTQGHI